MHTSVASLIAALLIASSTLAHMQTTAHASASPSHVAAYVTTTSIPAAPMLQPVSPAPARAAAMTNFSATAAPVPSSFVSQVESEVLRLTNIERVQNGLAPLAADSALAAIARAHSADMLAKNYFSHTDQSGCDGACRMTNAGYSWQTMGENIHAMWGYSLSATEAANKIVTDWMNSAGHRENILNPKFTEAGIGVAMQGTSVYSTADYALPR